MLLEFWSGSMLLSRVPLRCLTGYIGFIWGCLGAYRDIWGLAFRVPLLPRSILPLGSPLKGFFKDSQSKFRLIKGESASIEGLGKKLVILEPKGSWDLVTTYNWASDPTNPKP